MITAFVIACALILIEAGIIAFLACVIGDMKKDAAKYHTPVAPIVFDYEEESAK